MARIETEVTMLKEAHFTRKSFSGYGYEDVYIYRMTDANGKVYVWKTTSYLKYDVIKGDEVEMYFPEKGDIIRIRATIKGESEYKGEMQTEINRIKVTEVIYKYRETKYREQMDSIAEGDFIWHEMPYKQYKESYSDCEMVIDSFNDHEGERPATVDVIIRAGRMKPSGVRGEHFKGYELENEEGKRTTYRAVSEDNALKRAHKEHPEHTWECVHIYDYRAVHRIW